MSTENISKGNDFTVIQGDRSYGGAKSTRFNIDGDTGEIRQAGATFSEAIKADARAWLIADPGNAKAIPVTQSGVVALKSAGAETRTLARPTFVGQQLLLVVDTYVGNIVITASAGVNAAGNTALTFGAAGRCLKLEGATIAGALAWRIVGNDGVTLA